MPGTWPFAHEMKSPRRQASQVKSQPPNHPTPTRSPMLHASTPSPRASTAPATSWPGARGKSLPIAPNTVSESEWQTPQAGALTRTWPGPGSGTSTSTTSNCPLASVTRAIFIVPMAATLPPRDIAARCVPLESRRVGLRPKPAGTASKDCEPAQLMNVMVLVKTSYLESENEVPSVPATRPGCSVEPVTL